MAGQTVNLSSGNVPKYSTEKFRRFRLRELVCREEGVSFNLIDLAFNFACW